MRRTQEMPNKLVKINRAPVLTLWAAVVAERLGHNSDTALTLGKAVSTLNAQSKGKRLGIFTEPEEGSKKPDAQAHQLARAVSVTLLGRAVPVVRTKDGLRAAIEGEAIDPQAVKRYLAKKFGEDLSDVRAALEALASAYSPTELESRAYSFYAAFRPNIPEAAQGWASKRD